MSLLGLQRAGSGPVVVWLHGFTQTKNSALEFRSILAETCEVLSIDLPGHGDNAATYGSLDETADLLAAELPREPFVLGGYSLGGRVALHVALRHPARLAGLVLLSTTLGINDPRLRRARRDRDEKLARRIESMNLDAFMDEWLSQPLFTSLTPDPAERSSRSRDRAGLAESLRRSGTGTQSWLGERVASLDLPTLVIVGEHDAKFRDEGADIRDRVLGARLATVANAGHAAHLERPGDVAALVASAYPQ